MGVGGLPPAGREVWVGNGSRPWPLSAGLASEHRLLLGAEDAELTPPSSYSSRVPLGALRHSAVAAATGLSRQAIYRIKESPEEAEAALARWAA